MRNPSSMSSSSPSSKPPQQSTTRGAAVGNKTTPLKRGPWTPEEDELLATYIKREGEGRWRTLPKKAGLHRCPKSCRLRWMNYLRPCVKRGHIAPDEEDLILRLHRLLGNRWSLIAGRIPGRTDNEIKNYWNTHLSKKLISQGIDPRTHKPLESNEDKASSSKANHHHHHHNIPIDPNSNYVPPSPFTMENTGSDGINPINGVGGVIKPDDEYQRAETTVGNENMQNADAADHGYGVDLRSNHECQSNEDDEGINYCSDDIFSSFLNSLINEDVFNSENLVQPQQNLQPNDVINATSCDALISSTPAFTFGPGWDAPVVSCTSSFDQNDNSKRLNENAEEHPQ